MITTKLMPAPGRPSPDGPAGDGPVRDQPGAQAAPEVAAAVPYRAAEGIELLGPVQGSGYREGTSLVRRADGRMVQLSPLLYGLLESLDGERGTTELADSLTGKIGRKVGEEHVHRLLEKLGQQGLLAGTEHVAPASPNPLLALRWKVLITKPRLTRILTAPFTFLFRSWVMWPATVGFFAVFWFVLIHKGVASATAQAFSDPGLLLLVFVLAVVSAGFHELGHAAACRYGGAEPRGMGMGLYLVWPCFYTDVTDAYRLPRRARLRVDLAGLYFNALVAVVTMLVWLAWRVDALLLLVALQLLQMIKQLSPVIRADGYHILSDATGVPDLYAHLGPTLKRMLPSGRRDQPSMLRGWTRVLVTVWVLVMVPVLASLMLGAVLLLPRLIASAWDSGRQIADQLPADLSAGHTLAFCAGLLRILALALPVLGSILVTQKAVRSYASKARDWSRGRPGRRLFVTVVGSLLVAGLAWAWWPSGQYQPVRSDQKGTLLSLATTLAAPQDAVRPSAPARVKLLPGTYLAVAMIPVGGATGKDPAVLVLPGGKGQPPTEMLMSSDPSTVDDPTSIDASPADGASGGDGTSSGSAVTSGSSGSASSGSSEDTGSTSAGRPAGTSVSIPAESSSGTGTGTATGTGSSGAAAVSAEAFPFTLPSAPRPGDSQALAVDRTANGVVYNVTYSLVTVTRGRPVTNRNSAYALANCQSCTTVAVSVQVVLVVGQSKEIAPINEAEALNGDCPACDTTAVADQIVVTLKAKPSPQLVQQIDSSLQQLNAIPSLGAGGTPAAVAAQVSAVEQQIDQELTASGLLASPLTSTTTTSPSSSSTTSTTTGSSTSTTSSSSDSSDSSDMSNGSASSGSGSSGSTSTSGDGTSSGTDGSSGGSSASGSSGSDSSTTTTDGSDQGSTTSTTEASSTTTTAPATTTTTAASSSSSSGSSGSAGG